MFCNICFFHSCLDTLLSRTLYERTKREFDSNDPFVIGATDRGTLLGDWKYRDGFGFGMKRNNDILINIASDSYEALDVATTTLKASYKDFLALINDTISDRGIKGSEVSAVTNTSVSKMASASRKFLVHTSKSKKMEP